MPGSPVRAFPLLCCRARDSRLSMLRQMLPMVLPLLGCCDINLLLCNTNTVAQTKDRTSRCGSYVVGRSAVITKVTKDKPVPNNASRYHGAITCTKNMTYWSMFTVISLRSRSSCAIAFPLVARCDRVLWVSVRDHQEDLGESNLGAMLHGVLVRERARP